MLKRTTLGTREHSLIEALGEFGITAQDQTTTRTSQCLVGGGGDHITVGNWAGMHTCCHQPGNVRHIGEQEGTHFIRNGTESREIDGAGIGRITADDQLGLVFERQLANRLHIQALRLLIDAVLNNVEPLATHVHRRTVGEVTSMAEVHAHDRVAWLQEGQEHGEVGLSAAMGLNIRPSCTEQLFRPFDRQLLDCIHVLTTAVVALVRQPFGVLIGENGSLSLHHRAGGEVLRRDQLKVGFLTVLLLLNQGSDRGVGIGQCGVNRCGSAVRHRRRPAVDES